VNAAQPTDTIRDAFEAMLWFLACLIGPLRPRKITPAEEIGALAACEVETDFEPDEPPAPLLALRDIIQRAAEEHVHPLRIVYGGADWTPERLREARERCERATPGPWRTVDRWDGSEVRSDPGTRVIVAVDLCAEDAAFIAHARADLPAALAEIERLRDLLREADKAPAEKCARCDKPAGETAVRDGVDTLCMACSIDDLDGRYIDGESGSR
jgi:hypothetical protein